MSSQSAESLETWNSAQLSNPELPDQALAKAVTAHLFGNAEQALEQLESGDEPDRAERMAAGAHLWFEMGRQEQAAQEYEKLCELRPSYAEAHYQLGASRYHLGQFAQALESFQKGSALDPSRADQFMM